ncbi:MAG TPA: HEAT repeat domain-containing protein, partial [Geobacteraceae bacterium]
MTEHVATAKRREALALLLKDSHVEVRQAAAQALERLEGKMGLPEILDLLRKGRLAEKVRAIYALGEIGGPKAVAALVYCAGRPEDDIRSAAIEALGNLAEPSTAALLVEKLQEPDSALQAKAIQALAKFNDSSLAGHLVGFLAADDGLLAAEAARALGRIGGPDLEERLVQLT